MRHTKTLAGTAALTLALALAACGSDSSDSSSGDKLADLKDKGTITVAFAGEEPYSFEKDGELTGATIALHKKIFKDMGIKEVKGVKTEWNALIPGLKAGRYDAISAGMSILPDRCKEASLATRRSSTRRRSWCPRATRRTSRTSTTSRSPAPSSRR